MRNPASAIERYIPGDPPSNPEGLKSFLQQELAKIASMLSIVADGQLEKTHVVPTKPRDGMIRYFDGTNANPIAAGEGIYTYFAGSWKKL